MPPLLCNDAIEPRIHFFRGHYVLLDADLARIFGVSTKRLIEEIRRHGPLPGDFCFPLEPHELALSDDDPTRRHHPVYAFTEYGALMAATLLHSHHAIAI